MLKRSKAIRQFPDYFRQDQVGGLSDLFIMASRSGSMGDLESYAKSLESRFGYDYTATSMIGIGVLLVRDKKKYSELDELVPETPPRTEIESQQLLSVVIHNACEPIMSHDEFARMLFPSERIRQRAISHISVFIDECKTVAEGWWKTTGNAPIRASKLDQMRHKGISELVNEFGLIMTKIFKHSLFESVDSMEVQKNLLEAETNLAAASGIVNAMQRIWPDGQDIFDRLQLAISELLQRRSFIEEFAKLFELEISQDELNLRFQEIIAKNREVLMIVGKYIAEASDLLYELTGIRLEIQK